jgi:peptidoglycan/LPS O-acetylase OafA/YrhL
MRIKELDGLRGIAVLAVMSEHYLSWLPAIGSQFGWLGVDLFFILSGFLITSILLELRDKEHYFKVFYARRALRIFPPYFLGIFVYLCVSFALKKMGTWGLWLQYVFYYTSLFVGQPPQLHATPPVLPLVLTLGLAVLWSLSVEEIYYTIWAPVVRYTTQKGFTAILAGMILSAPLLRWWLHTPQFPEIYTFYCRMDGLAYGSAAALLLRDRRLSPGNWLALDKWFDRAAIIVLPVTVAFWLITRGDKSKVLVVTLGLVLADLSFALFAHALIRRTGGNQLWVRALRSKWLRSIGMVSYSLYLFHYPLRALSIELVAQLHLSRRADAITSVLLGVGLSFGVAYGLWYGMESRILQWKDRKVPSPAHPEIPFRAKAS